MNAGGNVITDLAAFLGMATQDSRKALNTILHAHPEAPLVAVPVGAHFTQPIRSNALLSNPSSILNYSQARIVGLKNTYALLRAATDAILEIVSDSRFDAREIGTKYVKKLEKKLLKGFDRGDVSAFNRHEGRYHVNVWSLSAYRSPLHWMVREHSVMSELPTALGVFAYEFLPRTLAGSRRYEESPPSIRRMKLCVFISEGPHRRKDATEDTSTRLAP